MLRVDKLNVAIGLRVLLDDFCASWPAGSLIALVGPNGSGKTTLLNHLCGLNLRTSGKVFVADQDVFAMKPRRRAALISSIPQHDSAPLETLVRDRIAHGLYATTVDTSAIDRVAHELLINDLLDHPLHTLSGGQRKKVHIARALVNEHALVYMLDEPDAHLDEGSRALVMDLLLQRARSGKLVIAALHHRDLADEADTTEHLGLRL